jgi:AcrR family transcriptional regulator
MPSEVRFDVSAARKLAQQRVNETSLRAVADEIGLSKSGLDHFLKGRQPYSRTRAQLAAWMMRNRHPDASSIQPEAVDAAIALLERYIHSVGSASVRDKRVREVTAKLFHAPERGSRKQD